MDGVVFFFSTVRVGKYVYGCYLQCQVYCFVLCSRIILLCMDGGIHRLAYRCTLTHTHTHTHTHGWEIAVILRNFRKTKLSKSIFLKIFLLLYFNMYTMCDSTTFALRHTQISLSGILRHFARQAVIFFCTRMIQTSEPGIRGFSQKWKSKIAENFFFRGKQIHRHTLFFKQSVVGVVESMEITRERMPVCQQNRALMELSFVDICIFQAISVTEVYGRSWLVKKVC